MQPRHERKAVGLLVSLKSASLGAFIEQYATNLSKSGMFVRSRKPLPVGTPVELEVRIAGGVRVIQCTAQVRWARQEGEEGGPAGMGLEFVEFDEFSEAVLEKLLEKAAQSTGATPEEAPLAEESEAPSEGPAPSATGIAPDAAWPPAPRDAVDVSWGDLLAARPEPQPSAKSDAADAALSEASVDVDVDLSDLEEPPAPAPPVLQPAAAALAPAAPALEPTPRPQTVFLTPPAEIVADGPIIGIDLGTTNSCVAILARGRPVVLRSKEGHNTIPSVVAMSKRGDLLVGHRARGQLLLNPAQTIYGAKRLVGRQFDSSTVQQVRDRFHYQIVLGQEGRAAVKLGEHTVNLEEVQGLVLQECKQMAEQHLQAPVSRAVVTVPAYYSEPQREAVRRAGALAGLKVERILNEPTAAALAYGLNRQLSKRVLVYDLGGGTFDATLLRIDQNVFEVLATGGDVFLGGIDFDSQLVDLLLERFQERTKLAFNGETAALARVTEAAEQAKVALSEQKTTEVLLPVLMVDDAGKPRDLRCTLTRADVEEACAPLLDRTFDVLRDVLLDAKLKASQVDEIILVGGQTRMPMVRERLRELFGKNAHASVNADEAVAIGAALYSGTVDKVSSMVLIDVLPMTIGVGMHGGGFKRVLERNSPLPVSKSIVIPTSRDQQETLEFSLFQGEDGHVSANEYLGTVRIDGLPRHPKGQVRVLTLLKIDAECVLHVEACELSTRRRVTATVATRYAPEELQRQLKFTSESARSAEQSRGEDLKQRGGRFWKLLKKVIGRT